MITQTHQGKHEVEHSIVNLSELEGALRIDAEYYDPVYVRNEDLIKTKKWGYVGDYLMTCQYGISIAMNEEGDGYKMLKMDDIIGILADDANAKYAPISEDLFKKYKLNKKDVLFNRVNSEEFVGRTGIYLLDGDHTFASYLIRIRAKQDYANSYITIFLKTKYGEKTLRRVSRRAVNQANINAEELKQLKIPTPTDTFQKEIENLVLESQQERENAEHLYKKAEDILLEELKLKEWKPKTKKIVIDSVEFEEEKNISIKKLSEVLEVDRLDAEYWVPKYDEFLGLLHNLREEGQIDIEKLGELVDYKKGIEVGSKQYFDESEIPFIRVSNLTPKGIDLTSAKYIRKELYEEIKKEYEPKAEEILFTKDGSIGVTYLLREQINSIISGGILRLILKRNIDEEYLELVLNSLASEFQIEREKTGALIEHFKPKEIMCLLVPLVNPKIQSPIAQKIQQSFESRRRSKELLEIAKKSVEVYIEKDEEEGSRYINEELQKMETN